MALRLHSVSSTFFTAQTNNNNTTQERKHPVVNYFEKNKTAIQEQIDRQVKRVNGKYRDFLNLETVMNNVFLRTFNIQEENLTPELISHHIRSVIKGRSQDTESGRFSRKHSSGYGGEDKDENSHSEIFLHDPTPRERVEKPNLPSSGIQAMLEFRTKNFRESQQTLIHLIGEGLTKREVCEATQTRSDTLGVSIETLRNKVQKELELPPHTDISHEKWKALPSSQRIALEYYLIGLGQDAIQEEIGGSPNSISNLLSIASENAGIESIDKLLEMRSKTVIESATLKREREFSFINFVFKNNSEPPEFTSSSELFTTLTSLTCFLTNLQKQTLDLHLEGLRNTDIAHITKRRNQEVYHTLEATRETLREKYQEYIEVKCPKGFDKIKWLQTRSQSRVAINLFTQRFDYSEIAKKMGLKEASIGVLIFEGIRTLEITKDDLEKLHRKNKLIHNKRNHELIRKTMLNEICPEKLLSIKDYPQKQIKLFNTLCQILSTRKKMNLRPFKLYILGLRKYEIADLLKMAQPDIKRSIDVTVKALREKYKEYENAPKGLDPIHWIKLNPKTKKIVELYLSGNDYREIQIDTEINLKDIESVKKYLRLAIGILKINPNKLLELRDLNALGKVA